jgi:hypothetical protein
MRVVRARLLLLAALFGVFGCNPRITTIGSFAARDAPSDAGPDAPSEAGTGHYLEAESGALSGGFVIGDDSTASGGHFITPHVGASSDGTVPGPARATYEIDVETAGTYQIWGRIQALDLSVNRFWFQVDGGAWIKWRITTGNIWWWDFLHDNILYETPISEEFSVGKHELVIANDVDGVGIDRLYYASDGSKPVGDETKCNPPNSIDIDGGCHPSCGSLGGTMCSTSGCMGMPTVNVYDCPACCPAVLPAN